MRLSGLELGQSFGSFRRRRNQREGTPLNGDIALRQNTADDLSMLVAEHVLLQLRREGLPDTVGAVVSRMKQGFVAVPGVAQVRYFRHLAFDTDVLLEGMNNSPHTATAAARDAYRPAADFTERPQAAAAVDRVQTIRVRSPPVRPLAQRRGA